MCGIAGIIKNQHTMLDLKRISSAMHLLEHRGPDDCGYLLYSKNRVQLGRTWPKSDQEPEVVLLHRRLSILDLTHSGWQPMGTPDGRYFVVYNGEIYNYIELREELEQLGYRFHSSSDTEVLLTAYSCWGSEALPRLIGMFSFALFDTQTRKLVLARDYFGIKPLYYTYGAAGFAFASEVKALLELAPAHRHIVPERLYLYLRYGLTDQGTATLLSDIHQVPPAHYCEVMLDNPGDIKPVRYWKPAIGQNLEISFEEAASTMRELFLKNVRLHLRSDVPIGAALSGGIDSSSIVMAMRYLDNRLDLHTFSYIAADPLLSEEQWVDLIGRLAHAQVHKVYPLPEELSEHLAPLTYMQDEPFGSTSIYAQYCVFRMASEAGIKVMLDGQGADEILGGYRYYLAARLTSIIRQNRWSEAVKFLHRCRRLPGTDSWQLLLKTADYLLPSSLQAPLRPLVQKDLMPSWLNERWFAKSGFPVEILEHPSGTEVLKGELLQDLTTTSLPHLLRYEDRNSMAFSIESRVPFLTPELVNFVFSLPEEFIIAADGTTKAVFRRAMRDIVPDSILSRKDKVGFATPELRWLRLLNDWAEGILKSEVAANIPALKHSDLRKEWEATLHGQKPFDFRLWRVLNVICWTERFGVQYN